MAGQSYTVNIHGGQGGAGGNGGHHGGAGGAGEGPTTNFEAATLHLQSVQGSTSFTAGTVNHHCAEAGINILHRGVALEALFDSADSYPQPRCHPETRIEMLDILYNWAVQDYSPQPIRWLHGPAGAGKSAIMQTLCRKLQAAGRLGGTFFFKRNHPTRGNAKVLFATLAYQLAINDRNLRVPISRSVEYDPSVVGRFMDIQLRELILEPCQLLTNCPPVIILIDGLDECQDEGTQQEIVRLVGSTVATPRHPCPLRFLIASRPEAHICEAFENPSFNGILDFMNVEQSFQNVHTYFCHEFTRIHREHLTMRNVPTPWPTSEVLKILIEKSSGYFVYASTVIKFIDDKKSRPTERLAVLQNLSSTQSDTPFAALDQLYFQILSGVPARFRSKLRDILHCTIVANVQLTPAQLDWLFDLEPGDVQLILRSLHSVLKVPSNAGTISVHHASFLDFLQDERRSTDFHINSETRMNVARAVLKALSDNNHWLDTRGHPLTWRLAGDDLIKCLILISPLAELVPLIQCVNPDFLWGKPLPYRFEKDVENFLIWLKT
ncbi:hypothetical protein B0H13DRAFT_390990 [Mycena leptocephala]|nr:hypothetical protein B0H13DRAFT_390990 [Mycena leptocephala]